MSAEDNFKLDENGRNFSRVENTVGKGEIARQALVFTCLQYKSFENTVGKGEIAHIEQFLLFPQCFLPV